MKTTVTETEHPLMIRATEIAGDPPVRPKRLWVSAWQGKATKKGLAFIEAERRYQITVMAIFYGLQTGNHILTIKDFATSQFIDTSGFRATCSCGKFSTRATGCHGSGYWYARHAAYEKFVKHVCAAMPT